MKYFKQQYIINKVCIPVAAVVVVPVGVRCSSSVSAAEARCYPDSSSVSAAEAAVAADGAGAAETRCWSSEEENIHPAAGVAAGSAVEDAAAERPSDDAGPEAEPGYEDYRDGAGSGFEDS